MKSIRALLILMVFMLTGCATTITPATNIADIQEVDFTQTFKTGKSCVSYFLGFGPFGNISVVEAAKSANIRTVALVEYESKWAVIVSQTCAVVHGR